MFASLWRTFARSHTARLLLWCLLLVAGTTVMACSFGPTGVGAVHVRSGDGEPPAGQPAIRVAISVPPAPMGVKARQYRQQSDVDHYTVRLYTWTGSVLGGAVGKFAFTNVTPGTYRIRVKASKDTNASSPSPSNDISASDNFFTQAFGWEISDGTCTVNSGASLAPTYAGPGASMNQLDIMLKLKDPGDDVVGNIMVTPGSSMVGARDL